MTLNEAMLKEVRAVFAGQVVRVEAEGKLYFFSGVGNRAYGHILKVVDKEGTVMGHYLIGLTRITEQDT